jgi:type IV conjugative transfer system pilin TraA
MKIATTMTNLSIKIGLYVQQLMPFIVLGMLINCLFAGTSFAEGGGTNHLGSLKADISQTFGKGSDMQYFLLLAEGLAGAYAYIKTKNIVVLGGLPLLMVFTHWALK